MNSKLRSVQSLCLALTLTVVPEIICIVATVSGYGAYVEYQAWRHETPPNSTYETLAVDSQGRVVVTIRTARSQPVVYLDTERKPLEVDRETTIWLRACSLPLGPRRMWPLQGPREQTVVPLAGPQQAKENWFLVFNKEQSRAWFEAYDTATRERIGFLGLNGFQQGIPDETARFPFESVESLNWNHDFLNRESFEYPFRNPGPPDVSFDRRSPVRDGQWILHAGESVYLVDAFARSTRELLPGHRIRSMAPASRVVPIDDHRDRPGAQPRYEYQIWLALRTEDRLILLNPEADLREDYVLPANWRERDFQLYLASDGLAVLISFIEGSVHDVRPGVRQYENDVAWISHAGETRRQARVPIEQRLHPGQVREQTSLLLATLSVAGPLQSAFVAAGIIPWFDSIRHGTRFADRAVVSLEQAWMGLLCVTIVAAALAWQTDRYQRAYHLPRSYLWLTFVFLLGLPGYVAYFCHRRWPILCPVSPPEKTGIEILA